MRFAVFKLADNPKKSVAVWPPNVTAESNTQAGTVLVDRNGKQHLVAGTFEQVVKTLQRAVDDVADGDEAKHTALGRPEFPV